MSRLRVRFLAPLLAVLCFALGPAVVASEARAMASPACAQELADHERPCGGEASTASCHAAACSPVIATNTQGVLALVPRGDRVATADATPTFSLTLAPDPAPPRQLLL